MNSLPISAARNQLASLAANIQHEPVTIVRYGQPIAVLVSPRFFERALDALEDLEDLQAVEEHKNNPQPGVPWEHLCKQMGWSPADASAEEIAEVQANLGLSA